MDEVNYPYEYMRQTGRPVGQNFGYKYDGFFSEEDVANYENLRVRKAEFLIMVPVTLRCPVM